LVNLNQNFQINLDNEVVGMVTRKDLAAPIASTSIGLKIKTSKRSTVLKGQQLTPKKRSSVASATLREDVAEVPYERMSE
jgi:hypothetical protein